VIGNTERRRARKSNRGREARVRETPGARGAKIGEMCGVIQTSPLGIWYANPDPPRSRPMFTMSAEEIARLRELQAQMERERQEDEASDVLSRHGDAPSQPSGSWSSSDPSSATRNRRRRNREIYELRRGLSAPANPAAARRCPYI